MADCPMHSSDLDEIEQPESLLAVILGPPILQSLEGGAAQIVGFSQLQLRSA